MTFSAERRQELAALCKKMPASACFSPDDDPQFITGLIVQRLETDPVHWYRHVWQEFTW